MAQNHTQEQNTPQEQNNKDLLDEFKFTLDEFTKACNNIVYIHHTFQSTGVYQILSSKTASGYSLIDMFKNMDWQQIYALMRSPMVQRMISDPEFFALFTPDTGTTPGTQAEMFPKMKK